MSSSTYRPIKQLDPIPDEREVDSSEPDMDFGKAEAEETLSFLRWRRSGEAHARWALSRGHSKTGCMGAAVCLIPWIINMILAVCLVSVVWKLDDEPSHFPAKDLLYSG